MNTSPRVWAHRGASAAKPENTVEAFVEAARMGADGVELDVRRSADHALVVCHDAALPDGRFVKDITVAELPPSVVLLDAALEACGSMVVNVEIKNHPDDVDYDPSAAIVSAVAGAIAGHDVIVSCFDLETLDRFADAAPDVPRGYLASPRLDQHDELRRAVEHGHHAFHPHQLWVNDELVAAAHAAGLDVNTWTADDPDRIRWLAAAGVDVVMTNVPDIAIAALVGPS